MRLDLHQGLTGNYDEVSRNVNLNLFVKQNREPGTKIENPLRGKEKAWWAGEHEGYWKDAVVRTAFLLDEPAYQKQAGQWMEEIVEAQGKEGYIGIYSPEGRFPSKGFDGELWTQSRMFQALLAYHEFTGEQRVLDAVERAVSLTLGHYMDEGTYFGRPKNDTGGGVPHGVGFMDSLEWLYRLTGKSRYKEGAVWLFEDYSASETGQPDMRLKNLLDPDKLWVGHTPHITEGLHMPQISYAFTGKEEYRRAADNTLVKLDLHMNPGGGIVGNESVRSVKGGGKVAGEYCSVTESAYTLNRLLAYRKDLAVGDRVERGTLNHAQGARFHAPNRAALYLAYDNQSSADDPRKYGDRHLYAATHRSADCCTLNSTRQMPHYVDGMWYQMENPSDALVANLYGPSRVQTQVQGVPVEIVEKTDYPFSDEIVFEMKPDRPVAFDLVFRVPQSKNNLTIDAAGAEVQQSSERASVRKKWRRGDRVRVNFNFEVERREDHHGQSYYQRGPLVFALAFPETRKRAMEFELGGEPSGFYRYLIDTEDKTGWEYRIDPQARFELVRLPGGDMQHPWLKPPLGLRGQMVDDAGERVEVTLLPEGATHLRRVTFPVAG